MINLLPPEIKSEIGYARKNSHLVRWILLLIIVIIAIIIVISAGLLFIKNSESNYLAQIDQGKMRLREQQLEETQAKIQNISSSIKLSVDVLSKQVLFSKFLTQIGTIIPPNSKLTDLGVSKLEGGIDLTAVAKDYTTATQVQLNLQDPTNKIFEKADIVSIQCDEESNADYPCTITVRALFAKNNDFLFINKDKK